MLENNQEDYGSKKNLKVGFALPNVKIYSKISINKSVIWALYKMEYRNRSQ